MLWHSNVFYGWIPPERADTGQLYSLYNVFFLRCSSQKFVSKIPRAEFIVFSTLKCQNNKTKHTPIGCSQIFKNIFKNFFCNQWSQTQLFKKEKSQTKPKKKTCYNFLCLGLTFKPYNCSAEENPFASFLNIWIFMCSLNSIQPFLLDSPSLF